VISVDGIGFQKLAADLVQHFAVSGHGLGQILHHGHLTYTSCHKMVCSCPPHGGQSSGHHIVCGFLLAHNGAHLADGLHTANQVSLDVHKYIPPKIEMK